MSEERNMDLAEMEEIDLSEWSEEFAEAEVGEDEFEPVPDGKYQVNVEKAELTRAKRSGAPMLKWTLKIMAPTHVGRLLWRNNVLASPENIKWLKKDLYKCGVELKDLTELPRRLDELLDLKLEVQKKTRDENENIYINKRLTLVDSGSGPVDADILDHARKAF